MMIWDKFKWFCSCQNSIKFYLNKVDCLFTFCIYFEEFSLVPAIFDAQKNSNIWGLPLDRASKRILEYLIFWRVSENLWFWPKRNFFFLKCKKTSDFLPKIGQMVLRISHQTWFWDKKIFLRTGWTYVNLEKSFLYSYHVQSWPYEPGNCEQKLGCCKYGKIHQSLLSYSLSNVCKRFLFFYGNTLQVLL